MKTKVRTVRIDDELWEQAAGAAKKNRTTIAAVIRQALVQYVKENQ